MYLEYISGGTLEACIQKMNKFNLDLVQVYTKQMIQGLVFMHSHNVIHRDLKPANVLVTIGGRIKLADFGTAFDISKISHSVQQTICGTPAFMAPEVIRREKHTTGTDIWSLGVIVYNMITGRIPFVEKDKHTLMMKIAKGELELLYPENCPKIACSFMDACLVFEPINRPSAAKLLEYALIKWASSCPSLVDSASTDSATQSAIPDSLVLSTLVDLTDLRSSSNELGIGGTEITYLSIASTV